VWEMQFRIPTFICQTVIYYSFHFSLAALSVIYQRTDVIAADMYQPTVSLRQSCDHAVTLPRWVNVRLHYFVPCGVRSMVFNYPSTTP
jgi:hypothetical protein